MTDVGELGAVLSAMREWQHDDAPVPLHPGDVGWFWRFGATATAAAVRTWRRDGALLAAGLLDGPRMLRLAVAPWAVDDVRLARRIDADLGRPERDVVPAGDVAVEIRTGGALRQLLLAGDWLEDEPWTPLRRDLAEPVEEPGVRVEVVGPHQAAVRAAVQRAAFDTSTFTAERWHAMAGGPAYADARCLLAFDDAGDAVATVTVWSAGADRPGLLEPMGVHRDHRGLGYGRAITVAAAAALRELGSSSAFVCTASSNVGGVATYRSAGFCESPAVRDLRRPS